MTELEQLSIYLTGKLNDIINALNGKLGKTETASNSQKLAGKSLTQVISNALTSIRNGVPAAGDDLNKLYNLILQLQAQVGVINIPTCMILNDINNTVNSNNWQVYNTWQSTFIYNNDTNLFSLTTDGIAVAQDGLYEVSFNMYFTSNASNVCVGVQVTKNTTPQNIISASSYIRNKNGHKESSCAASLLVSCNANDTIKLMTTRLANGGTVTTPAGNSCLTIKKISDVNTNSGGGTSTN